MATYVIGADVPPAGQAVWTVRSSGSTSWTTVRAGNNLSVPGEPFGGATFQSFGINRLSDSTWSIRSGFLSFNTSVIGSDTVVSAGCRLNKVNSINDLGGTLRMREDPSWSYNLSTSDWVAGANLTSLTLGGSTSFPAGASALLAVPLASNSLASGKFIMYDARLESGTTPSGFPTSTTTSATLNIRNPGNSDGPRLIVHTVQPSTLMGVHDAAVQLSDGSTVYLESDGNVEDPQVFVREVDTEGIVSTIDTLQADSSALGFGDDIYIGPGSGLQAATLVVDGEDNVTAIFKQASSSDVFTLFTYPRDGSSWGTRVPNQAWLGSAPGRGVGLSGVWCDNGSGLNNKGRVLIAWAGTGGGLVGATGIQTGHVLFDADRLLAGTVGGNELSWGNDPYWLVSSPDFRNTSGTGLSLATDVFGGTRVCAVAYANNALTSTSGTVTHELRKSVFTVSELQGLHLTTGHASTPHDTSLNITDLDLRVHVAPDQWVAGVNQALVAKYEESNGKRSYLFRLTQNGNLDLWWTEDGTNATGWVRTSTVLVPGVDGEPLWVRATLVVDDGGSHTVRFYTSDDGQVWTQLGSSFTSIATSIFASDVPLTVGTWIAGGAEIQHLTGRVFAVEVRDGIDGTIVASPDFTDVGDGWPLGADPISDPILDAQGNEWTLHGLLQGLVIDDQGGAQTPDDPSLDLTGDIDIRALVAADKWNENDNNIVSKYDAGAGDQRSWRFQVWWDRLQFSFSEDGTSLTWDFDRPFTTTPADGQPMWVRVTVDTDAGGGNWEIQFYTSPAQDGVNWTPLGDPWVFTGPSGGIFVSSTPVVVGSELVDGALSAFRRFRGRINHVEIRDGINGTIVANPRFYDRDEWLPGDTQNDDAQGNTWTLNTDGTGEAEILPANAVIDTSPATAHDVTIIGTETSQVHADRRAKVVAIGEDEWVITWQDDNDDIQVRHIDGTTQVQSNNLANATFPFYDVVWAGGQAWFYRWDPSDPDVLQRVPYDPVQNEFGAAVEVYERYVQHLALPGTDGNYASTPDHASLDIVGDIDLRAWVAPDEWGASGTKTLVAKYATPEQRSYQMVLFSGNLRMQWSPDGTSVINTATSTVVVPGTDEVDLRVRATLDVDDGGSHTVTFYTSEDGVAWTQLGDPVTQAGTTSIHAGTAPATLGARLASGSPAFHLAGRMFAAEVRDGIDGTVVANPDFTDQTEWSPGDTVNTDASGRTWTIQQSGTPQAEIAGADDSSDFIRTVKQLRDPTAVEVHWNETAFSEPA